MMAVAPYLPFGDGKPFALRMGLQPLPPEQWIEIDGAYAAQLKAKRELLATRHGDVLQALPEARLASEEALKFLLDHLRRYYPGRFAFRTLRSIGIGGKWDFAQLSLHPLEHATRLVQEDFCILQADDQSGDTYRLTAG